MTHQRYYVRTQGRVSGPFDLAQLKSLQTRGHLGRFHEVSADKQSWMPASSLADLFAPAQDGPPSSDPLPMAFTSAAPLARSQDPPQMVPAVVFVPDRDPLAASGRSGIRTGLSLILLTRLVFAGALFLTAILGLCGAAAGGTSVVVTAVVIGGLLFFAAQAVEAAGLGCCVANARPGSERGLLIGSVALAGALPLLLLALLIVWFASGATRAGSLPSFADQILATGPRVLLIVATLLGSARTLMHLFFWRSVALRRGGGREAWMAVVLLVAHVTLSFLALVAFFVLALASGVDGGRNSGPFLFALGMLLFTLWMVWQVYALLLLLRLRPLVREGIL